MMIERSTLKDRKCWAPVSIIHTYCKRLLCMHVICSFYNVTNSRDFVKIPGSQHEQFVDCQLEKVQKVGAQFLTASEMSDLSNQL